MIDPMPSLPVVLDVDTGVDDACALLLAALHPRLDLRAVTCVGGNAPLADVVRNTLVVLETAGRADVPVGIGARRPLLEEPVDARHVHGDDGMADLGMPAPTLRPDPRPAIDLLRDTIEQQAAAGTPVTVVPLAPMTNLALLARVHPQAFARIGRIVFMGGGVEISNATAAAEFNVFHDPEAAAMVLAACAEHDVPVTMYGLDVFYDPLVTDVQVDGLARARHPGGPPRRRPHLLPPPQVRQRGGDDRRRRRGRHPGRTGCRAHRAAAGARRAHRHLDARPYRRRPPRLGRAPRARPARPGADDGRRRALGRRATDREPVGAHGSRGGVMSGRVLVLGSLNVDLVTRVERHPRPGETVLGEGLDRLAGGKGANQAVAAAAAGASVAMVGCVGDDAGGAAYRARLERLGIDVSGVRVVAGASTGHALITVVGGRRELDRRHPRRQRAVRRARGRRRRRARPRRRAARAARGAAPGGVASPCGARPAGGRASC